jgi:hypothetical protein
MDSQIVKELKIHNLLTALNMSEDSPEINETRKKVLDYIVSQELSTLQYDITLFPKEKKNTKEYNFHLD